MDAVLLADGSVLAVGGGPLRLGGEDAPIDRRAVPVLPPERYDPGTGAWSVLAPGQRGRTYHSTALLLPDARVLVAGGDVELATQPPPAGLVAHTAEVFSPPYLFLGPRPALASAPAHVGYASAFEVATPDAGGVGRVALVRLGSVTHSVNFDQRYVDLPFAAVGAMLQVAGPAGPAQAPPGPYMLFLVSQQGVPSVAAMVQVG
jgi:hypothetical protein